MVCGKLPLKSRRLALTSLMPTGSLKVANKRVQMMAGGRSLSLEKLHNMELVTSDILPYNDVIGSPQEVLTMAQLHVPT